MPRTRALLPALLMLVAALAVAQERVERRPVTGGRAAEFDRLFEQLDGDGLRAATPEEAKANLARLRVLVPPGDARRELQYRFAECVQTPEDARASLEFARRGLADARARGDLEAQARFLYCQAAFEEMVVGSREAISRYSEGIAIARRAEHSRLVGDGLVLRGSVRSFLGEHAQALMDFVAAQRIYDGSALKTRAESNLQNIGIAYRRMGEYPRALNYLEQSRQIALQQQDWPALLAAWLQLGFLHEDRKDPDRALAAYQEALAVARQRLGAGDAASVYLAMASSRVMRGEHGLALEALAQARSGFASLRDTSNEGMLALLEGQARAGLGEADTALALFARAERIFEAERNERYLEMLYPERARLHERRGDARAALADFKRYVALREKLLDARNDQRSLMLRQQFDASRREIENERLRSEKTLRDQEMQALLKARRWQWGAVGLGVLLILLLGALVVQQLVRTRRLRVLALTDELTGVANRRRIELIAEERIAQAKADGRPLSLITFDIDHFKRINDTHGHLVGDRVIERVAAACQRALRQFDEIGRTGGEEFLVVLPDASPEAAAQVAERLRAGIEALRWDDVAEGLRVSISLGLATLQASDTGLRDLHARADAALYAAKGAGRNHVGTA
ncbi:GGDEF domain-containing protein [Lysobacter humi (ex Lee et al. 2017)]